MIIDNVCCASAPFLLLFTRKYVYSYMIAVHVNAVIKLFLENAFSKKQLINGYFCSAEARV